MLSIVFVIKDDIWVLFFFQQIGKNDEILVVTEFFLHSLVEALLDFFRVRHTFHLGDNVVEASLD